MLCVDVLIVDRVEKGVETAVLIEQEIVDATR